ncbi:MAG: hypothetical protein KIA06_04305 [Finegoldia magna]|uniref:hypothetical protein n=1 Tax=Finegoldia magna TaxID=1260 RepID=UPI0026EB71CE|nr:hypothetical protein [Finegoldia magna]MBS5966677.1 hypothetical protein [Finegoldia magna]
MNYTKIKNSNVYFRLSGSDNWKPISDLTGDDLIKLIEKCIDEDDFNLEEFDDTLIENEAHKIIYKSIYQKINDIHLERDNIIDENTQRYNDIIEKYSK